MERWLIIKEKDPSWLMPNKAPGVRGFPGSGCELMACLTCGRCHNWWIHPIPPAPAQAFPQLPGTWEDAAPIFPHLFSVEKQHPAPLATLLAGKRASAREFCWHGSSEGTQAELGLNSPKFLNPRKWGSLLSDLGCVAGVWIMHQRWPTGTGALSPQMCSPHEQDELRTRRFDDWNW